MKQNKILLTVTNDEVLEKVQDCNFLFPLQDYCCGYLNTYNYEEIKIKDSYILINRILNDEDLNKLKIILKKDNPNIKGIIFEDLGVLELINELGINVEKIYYMIHNGVNYKSVNEYLKYVDSVVISSDITKEEIKEILSKANKKCLVYTFGLLDIMYSRRTLLNNFNRYHNIEEEITADIVEPIGKKSFKIVENNYGTIFYSGNYYYDKEFINMDNIKYNIVNPLFLNIDEILDIIKRIKNNEDINIEIEDNFLKEKSIVNIKSDNK